MFNNDNTPHTVMPIISGDRSSLVYFWMHAYNGFLKHGPGFLAVTHVSAEHMVRGKYHNIVYATRYSFRVAQWLVTFDDRIEHGAVTVRLGNTHIYIYIYTYTYT